jgi:signal transduction histidine kinase/ActR/RegA family two-component response regulator
MDPFTYAPGTSIPLESVLCTEELQRRPSRPPDYQAENRALVALTQALADSPRTILQTLADTILEVFGSESAGVSLVTADETRFYWPAIAGVWKPHIGGGTPRDFGPCGNVLDRNSPLLSTHFERRYPYCLPVTPLVHECLLVPFSVEGKAVGTIWAITHDPQAHPFDHEDLRLLISLGRFASSAYWAVESLERLECQGEVLRDADRRKDEFLATLAHELRNPLAPMRHAVEILRLQGAPSPEQPWAVDVIDRQLRQLTRLLDDLLDLSRITVSRLDLRKMRIGLAEVLQVAAETSRPLIEEHGQAFPMTLPPHPIILDGDLTRLAQVFSNLLNNAAKYTDRGGSIWLTAEPRGPEAVVTVRDTGIGIPPELLPRIFEMFMQADQSLEHSHSGLGIGLTLARQIVELHGGILTASSDGAGTGSAFTVRLPVLPEAEPTPPRPRPARTRQVSVAAQRILVVDDERIAAASLGKWLTLMGHEVRAAHDGVEAVGVAEAFRPDVVLLDISLPKLNGYEVARTIRQQPWSQGMVLIALTGWGQEADRQRARDAGFDHHLVKPVDHTTLTQLLASQAHTTGDPGGGRQTPC